MGMVAACGEDGLSSVGDDSPCEDPAEAFRMGIFCDDFRSADARITVVVTDEMGAPVADAEVGVEFVSRDTTTGIVFPEHTGVTDVDGVLSFHQEGAAQNGDFVWPIYLSVAPPAPRPDLVTFGPVKDSVPFARDDPPPETRFDIQLQAEDSTAGGEL